jgi:hypothetical protein
VTGTVPGQRDRSRKRPIVRCEVVHCSQCLICLSDLLAVFSARLADPGGRPRKGDRKRVRTTAEPGQCETDDETVVSSRSAELIEAGISGPGWPWHAGQNKQIHDCDRGIPSHLVPPLLPLHRRARRVRGPRVFRELRPLPTSVPSFLARTWRNRNTANAVKYLAWNAR